MPLTIALLIYAVAMTAANLSVAAFGPVAIPLNSFALIGLDLALRDWLHVRLTRLEMFTLIVATGLLTWALNPAADRIALASSVAFLAAALADWSVFVRLPGSWLRRSMGSNIAGAVVDSLIFPTIAFGVLMPDIVAGQIAAKVAGGVMWAWLLSRTLRAEPSGKDLL